MDNLNWDLVWDNRDLLLSGLWTALQVSLVALVVSVVAGLLLALVRMARAPFSWLGALYVNVFRGVPALVSVIWVYFGLALALDVSFTVFQAGVIALSLLYSAFFAEIFRSALGAVPPGLREAGQALGLRRSRIFFSVVLPQAGKIALPNIGNMFIGMVKDTSTFTVIGLLEVVRVTQNLVSTSFQPFVLYSAAAAIYIAAAFAVDFAFRLVERSMSNPPAGVIAHLLRGGQRRRIDRVIASVGQTPTPVS
jgi:His/Glu/Gln/Arg/opine family amino acid ABC transporter permease subunit